MDSTDERIASALAVIGQGGVVAFPTETYYGLAVDPFNEKALSRLFALKKRPASKPVLTLISHQSQLNSLTAEVPELYLPLMSMWPAPLTLVFKALASLSPLLTGGSGTVAARISSHPLAAMLVARNGQPVTATSANISGHSAAVSASEVYQAFGARIDFILDGGTTPGGKGSTLVGLSQGKLVLVRDGVMEFEKITRAAKQI